MIAAPAKHRVCVVGALHLDIVVSADRLPRSDETILGDSVHFAAGGKGGNQAVAARRQGAVTSMIGAVGADAFGDALLNDLRSAGVDCSGVRRFDSTPSGMSVAIVERTGEYGAVVVSGANRSLAPEHAVLPGDAAVLLLQNEIPPQVNLAAAEAARGTGAEVIWNAAPMLAADPPLLALVDILILNRVEASAHFDREIPSVAKAIDAAGRRGGGPADLIVTLGGDGLVHHPRGGEARHYPAAHVEIRSAHGAGDAFAGAFAARRALGSGLVDCIGHAQEEAAKFVAEPPAERRAAGLSPA